MSVSREKLYAEGWVEPMLTVAARYDGFSSFPSPDTIIQILKDLIFGLH